MLAIVVDESRDAFRNFTLCPSNPKSATGGLNKGRPWCPGATGSMQGIGRKDRPDGRIGLERGLGRA